MALSSPGQLSFFAWRGWSWQQPVEEAEGQASPGWQGQAPAAQKFGGSWVPASCLSGLTLRRVTGEVKKRASAASPEVEGLCTQDLLMVCWHSRRASFGQKVCSVMVKLGGGGGAVPASGGCCCSLRASQSSVWLQNCS